MNRELIDQELQTQAEDYLDGFLPAALRAEFLTRLESDAALQQWLARERPLRAALRSMPSPNLALGYPSAAVIRAISKELPIRSQKWIPLALAASLTAFALGVFWRGGTEPSVAPVTVATKTDDPLPRIELSLGKSQDMSLRISAPGAFERVRFSLTLPAHVGLAERPGVRQMNWEGSLKRGVNLLSLPLVGDQIATGQLVASVSVDGFQENIAIELLVVDAPLDAPPTIQKERGVSL